VEVVVVMVVVVVQLLVPVLVLAVARVLWLVCCGFCARWSVDPVALSFSFFLISLPCLSPLLCSPLLSSRQIQRETGRKAQLSNIQAGKAVSDIIRTTLGPRSMLKMLLDPMGGIVMTNDGNSILREVDVSHPAAKSMIELSRAQEEEVGDGTTSVIVLAGEFLAKSEPLLERQVHPTVICNGYLKALDDAVKALDELAIPLDLNDSDMLAKLVESCTGTKFISKFSNMMVELSLEAVRTVLVDEGGRKDIDIKRYAKVEKIPGGDMDDCRVLKGVMINKDVVHAKMRRRIEKPRILLLDCTLEYKKGESQTQIELSDEKAWEALLEEEERAIKEMCNDIIAVKPDLVVTEKGVSDLAQHYLQKANISVLRRVRKTDNNRIARATGATICHRRARCRRRTSASARASSTSRRSATSTTRGSSTASRPRRARSSCAARPRTCSTRSSATSATR
jgi:T-complex protein 1 subunit gamma